MTAIKELIDAIEADFEYEERRRNFIITCYAVLAGMAFGTGAMLVILRLAN